MSLSHHSITHSFYRIYSIIFMYMKTVVSHKTIIATATILAILLIGRGIFGYWRYMGESRINFIHTKILPSLEKSPSIDPEVEKMLSNVSKNHVIWNFAEFLIPGRIDASSKELSKLKLYVNNEEGFNIMIPENISVRKGYGDNHAIPDSGTYCFGGGNLYFEGDLLQCSATFTREEMNSPLGKYHVFDVGYIIKTLKEVTAYTQENDNLSMDFYPQIFVTDNLIIVTYKNVFTSEVALIMPKDKNPEAIWRLENIMMVNHEELVDIAKSFSENVKN